MPSPDYLPLSLGLPAVYQDDQVAFAQLDPDLDLADTLIRSGLTALEDAETWLSPESLDQWPTALAADAGRDAVHDAQWAVQDALAAWTGFAFPPSWPTGAAGLKRLPRLPATGGPAVARPRHTTGVRQSWRSASPSPTPPERPRRYWWSTSGSPTRPTPAWLTSTPGCAPRSSCGVTRSSPTTDAVARRSRSSTATRRPTSRSGSAGSGRHFMLPTPPKSDAGPVAVATWQQQMRDLLCSVVSEVDHGVGIRIGQCADEGRPQDRLDVGQIPASHTP